MSLSPNGGPITGGAVIISGSGFACPSPAVRFGSLAATVTACSATSLSVTAPAAGVGTVNVTVTNPSAVASNALTYTYRDDPAPRYMSVSASGSTTGSATLTFDRGAVCVRMAGDSPSGPLTLGVTGDIRVTVNGGALRAVHSANAPTCDAIHVAGNGSLTFSITFDGPVEPWDVVSVELRDSGAKKLRGRDGKSPASDTHSGMVPVPSGDS